MKQTTLEDIGDIDLSCIFLPNTKPNFVTSEESKTPKADPKIVNQKLLLL